MKVGLAAIITLAACHVAPTSLIAQDFHVEALKTEYQRSPIGMDARTPRLSWRITPSDAPQCKRPMSSASRPTRPRCGSDRFGRPAGVTSPASVLRPYGGPALRSGTRCYWQVRVWDDAGRASPWSTPAFWEMGLLEPGDWTAGWI